MRHRTLNRGISVRGNKTLALAAAAGAAFVWVRGASAALSNVPIAVTGWNQDVIAETNTPVEATSAPAFLSASSITKPSVLYYTGLPTNDASFVSASNAATTFQIPAYTGNNAILLNSATTSTNANVAPYGDTGMLTFTSPAAYGTLAILAASASIPGLTASTTTPATPSTGLPVNYTITFTDSTTTAGSFTPLPYNSSSTAYSLKGVASVNRVDPLGTVTSTRELFESDLSLPYPDQSKQIQSIAFSGSTAYNGSAIILAISGSGPVPTLVWQGGVSSTWDTTSANWHGLSTLYSDGNPVVFDDSAPSSTTSISIANAVAPSSVEFDNNTNSYSFTGAGITGSASLTLNGTGTTTLNNVNTYTGFTAVNSGTLIVGPTGAIASKTITVGSGGTFNVASSGLLTSSSLSLSVAGTANLAMNSLTVASLGGSGTLNLNGTALTINSGGFAGSIKGTGQLILNGSVALAGSNTYSGGTTLNSSALISIVANNVIGTGPLIFNGGSINNPATGVVYSLSNPWTFGANANTSGNTGVTYGTPYSLSGPGTLPAGTNTFNPTGGSLLQLSGPISGPGMLAVGSSGSVYVTNPNNTFTGGVSVKGNPSVVQENISVTSGELYLEANNAYTGPTLVTSVGILTVGAAGALGYTSGITVGSPGAAAEMIIDDNSGYAGLAGGVSGGAPLPMTIYTEGLLSLGLGLPVQVPYGALVGAASTSTTYAGPIALGTGGAGIGVGTNGSFGVMGVISSADSSPFQLGTNGGTTSITLGNANTYTGDTLINASSATGGGTLTIKLGNNAAIPATSGVTFNNGQGVLDLNGYSPSVTYLLGTGLSSVINSGGSGSTLTISNGNKSTTPAVFGGAITGNITLAKTGAGNQTLTAANSYSGGTTISGGKLTVTNPTSLGTGPVVLSGGSLVLTAGSGNVTGFSGMVLQGNAVSTGGSLTMTSPQAIYAYPGTTTLSSAFNAVPATVPGTASGFTASFTYSQTAPTGYSASTADGFTFTLQNDPAGTAALGDGGPALGYGANGDTNGIQNSGSVMFNVNPANGNVGTTFGFDGIYPAFTATGLVNMTTDPVQVTLQYNGSANTLTETLYDTANSATYSNTFTGVNFNSLLTSNTAYVGFTVSAQDSTDTQTISNFTFNNGNAYTPNSITNAISTTAGTSSVISATVSPGLNQLSLGSVSIAAGSSLALVNTGSGSMVVTVPSLSIAGHTGAWTGQLDLGTSSLVVSGAGATGLATITNQIKSGFNASGGYWNGNGIISSAAASDPSKLTTVGVLLNNDGNGNPLYGSGAPLGLFEGTSPNLNDVLVKYTYYGDANLDGQVNSADYTSIDNGYLNKLTGWQNGDFNYDGVINGSDYTLIDNAFNMQGAQISAELATSTAELAGGPTASAVPEPIGLSILGFAAAPLLLSRRRRRR
jgi:autotransporter-associated beta strand protein